MTDSYKILVPVDDSPSSRRAVEHVVSLARLGVNLEVHLLNVQYPVRGAAASLLPKGDLTDYHREEGMKALVGCRTLLDTAGIPVHLHVGVGDPGETVLAFAEQLACRQIVMGTRGLGNALGLVLGSVASHVVSHGTLPVTLLKAI